MLELTFGALTDPRTRVPFPRLDSDLTDASSWALKLLQSFFDLTGFKFGGLESRKGNLKSVYLLLFWLQRTTEITGGKEMEEETIDIIFISII